MRTIGYFDPSPGASGTTRYLLELLSGLDRSQYRAVLFASAPSPWHGDLKDLGAEVVYGRARAPAPQSGTAASAAPAPSDDTPAPKSRGPRAILRRIIGWPRWIRRETAELAALFCLEQVDLLHSNVAGEEVAPIAARRAGMPRVLATLHTDPTYDLFHQRDGAHHLRLQRRSFRALDLAIAVSARTATEWRSHLGFEPGDPPRTEVVPNGVRLDRLERRRSVAEAKQRLGLPADALVIGSLGRLDWAKGYGDMIAALPQIVAAAPRALFVHAGTGPLADRLSSDAQRLGVSERVRWLGFQRDVRDLLEACDLYVQPSWCEAHTLSVLEAGALSLPVVASDVGGHAETLADGAAGWIVPARDPQALAAAIITALASPALRVSKGDALRHRVAERYTHDRMVHATMTLYDELLQHAPPALATR